MGFSTKLCGHHCLCWSFEPLPAKVPLLGFSLSQVFLTGPLEGKEYGLRWGRLSEEQDLATCAHHLIRVMITITEHVPGARCSWKHLTDGSRNCHQHSYRSGAICMIPYLVPGRKLPFLKLMRGQVKKLPLFPIYTTWAEPERSKLVSHGADPQSGYNKYFYLK